MGTTRSKDAKLEEARQALEAGMGARPEIKARLDRLGFSTAAFQAGYACYKAAGGADIAVYSDLGQQRAATKDVNALRAQVDSQYGTLGRITDEIFKDDVKARTALGREERQQPTPTPPEGEKAVTPRPSKAQAAVLSRAHRLYEGALNNPDYLAEFAKVGYPKERLQAELDDVIALEKADIVQEQAKGQVQGSHTADKEARANVQKWLTHYKNIVTADLKDHPEWLTELTLKPRGRKPKSK